MKNSAEYQRRYRNAVPASVERDRAYKRAQSRAQVLLTKRYPRAYASLLKDELAIEGYESVGLGGPGVAKVRRSLGVPRKL